MKICQIIVLLLVSRVSADFLRVEPNGWRLKSGSAYASVNPETDTLVVKRRGFAFQNGSAVETVHEDVLRLNGKLRKPYPEGDVTLHDTVALTDYVYSGDVLPEGVENLSELTTPRPLMMWVSEPWQFITDNQLTLRLFCAHAYGRNGSPVAGVELIVTDGTRTVSKTVGELTDLAFPVSGLYAPVYEATLDISTLADGQITADAMIYPHVGEPFQISIHGEPFPGHRPQVVQKHFQNSGGSLTVRYAYVDAAKGGPAASASVSESPLNAENAPFADFNEAAIALAAAAGGDAAGMVMLLAPDQDHEIRPGLDAIPIGDTPIRIAAAAGSATVIDDGVGSANYIFTRARWENIVFKANGADRLFQNRAAGPDRYQVFSGCGFDLNGRAPSTGYFLDVGVCTFHNSTSNWGHGFAGVDRNKQMSWHVVGSRGFAHSRVYSVIGSYCDGQLRAFNTDDTRTPTHKGGVFAFNRIETHGGANNVKTDGYICGPEGLAVVGNVGAITGQGSDDNAEFFGGAPEQAQNVVWMHNTWAGGSHNGPRHNKGNMTLGDIRLFVRGNIFRTRIMAGDYHDAGTGDGRSGLRVDNWPSRFGVGDRFNFWYNPGAVPVHSYNSTLGDLPGYGSVYGAADASDHPGFVQNAAADGGNDHQGGIYHLVDDSESLRRINNVPRLPAVECAYPIDLMGAPVPLNGTALPGGLQPHTEVPESYSLRGDHDGDGIPNGIEYVLGGDVTRDREGGNLFTFLPPEDPASPIAVRYQRRKNNLYSSQVLQTSTNLVTWSEAAGLRVEDGEGLFEIIEADFLPPMDTGPVFFRIKTTRNEE